MASNDNSNNLDLLNEKQKSKMFDIAKKSGIVDLCRYMFENVNASQNVVTNIAVTGQSGSGKSSLVNALLELKASDPGFAKPGITQTTVIPTPHENPKYKTIIMWDLPGVGTNDFPRETYLEKVNYKKYDFFIIVGNGRFTENDTWLVKEAIQRGVRTYFVRTKVHQDLQNEKDDYPEEFDKDETLQRIKKECLDSLKDFKKVELFLIDNKQVNDYELNKLRETVFANEKKLTKEVFIRLFEIVVADILKAQRDMLTVDILKVATASGAAGIIPFKVGLIANFALRKLTMLRYRKYFAQDDESLQQIAKFTNMSLELLPGVVPRTSVTINTVKRLLKSAAKGKIISCVTEYSSKSTLSTVPLFGTVISASTSFGMTYYALKLLGIRCIRMQRP